MNARDCRVFVALPPQCAHRLTRAAVLEARLYPDVDRSASMSSTSTRRAKDKFATCPLLVRLFAHELHDCRKPPDTAHVHYGRQQRHQQRGIVRVEDKVTAEQAHIGAPTARTVANFTSRRGASTSDQCVQALPARGPTR